MPTSRPLPDFVSADDYHDGLQQIRVHLGQCGYGIGISRGKQTSSGPDKTVQKVVLQCARSKKYVKESKGIRKSTTRMTGCPWRAKMIRNPGGGWNVQLINNEHNHPINDRLNERLLLPRAKSDEEPKNIPSSTPPGSPKISQTPRLQQTPASHMHNSPLMQTPQLLQTPQAPLTTPPAATGNSTKRINVPLNQRLVSTTRYPFPLDTPTFLVFNNDFNKILGDNPDLKMVYQEQFPFAHRAPVYFPQNDFVFVASNQFVPAWREGTDSKAVIISKLSRKPDGSWARHEVHTEVQMASGGINHEDGILFCAQGDLKNSGGLVHMEGDFPFRTRTLLNNYYGRPFNSIKDLVVARDGSIWFTDPVYGHEQGIRPPPQLPNQVYRFDPKTGDVRVMADGFGRPSGICFSPYEKICYISDTDFIHGDGKIDFTKPATIYAYDIEERRQSKWLTNRRVFAMADVGVPDGLKCDMAGNVYVACADGLSVWNPGGVLLGKVIIPGGLANFCFGRRGELFLPNGKKFWVVKISTSVKGALLERMGIEVDQENREDDDDSEDSE